MTNDDESVTISRETLGHYFIFCHPKENKTFIKHLGYKLECDPVVAVREISTDVYEYNWSAKFFIYAIEKHEKEFHNND